MDLRDTYLPHSDSANERVIDSVLASDTFDGEFAICDSVRYKDDVPQAVMDIIAPMRAERFDEKYPLVVFVQGSGWTTPHRLYAFGRLLNLSARGYVVATISHRDSLQGENPFPAYLEDVKSAIRFLKLHASRYHIDSKRVGIWGTSSGANAALLVAMTAGDKRYDDGTNSGINDAVDYVVSCFAPSDIYGILSGEERNPSPDIVGCEKPIVGMSQTQSWDNTDEIIRQRAWDMSPVRIVSHQKKYPPLLLLHGDADEIVNIDETLKLYHLLRDTGSDVRCIKVRGGEHEGNFWSSAVDNVIYDFIDDHADKQL
ncbi:prolyl oligopeptidase family serine peptidase [Alloscardovia venturai]|uniref:Prolyl oligopeptidase family serine peptidase n=1 Tax=Alloscardovia venturai TaxID=1769421 RepID=A0ABW2Y3J3_9BIFI